MIGSAIVRHLLTAHQGEVYLNCLVGCLCFSEWFDSWWSPFWIVHLLSIAGKGRFDCTAEHGER
jgi:hypothetical protein